MGIINDQLNRIAAIQLGLSILSNDNLVNNPGFETPGTAPVVFYNWDESGIGLGSIVADTTPADVHSGITACKITNGLSGSCSIDQTVSVIPGQVYSYSLWVKGDGVHA